MAPSMKLQIEIMTPVKKKKIALDTCKYIALAKWIFLNDSPYTFLLLSHGKFHEKN